MYAEFDLGAPTSLTELLDALAKPAVGRRMLMAGGTVSLVDIRARKERPDLVLSIGGIGELAWIREEGGRIFIGSRTTVSELLSSELIARAAPSLVEASANFAGQMVRNTATIGGNIACGSPAADLVPPLLSLDAELELVSATSARRISLSDYYTGYKQDVRRPEEVIRAVILPSLPAGRYNAFYKLARRGGDAITVTSAAVTLAVRNGACSHVRIAVGSVAPVPMRALNAERTLEGKPPSPAWLGAAAEAAMQECSPIDDVRASAAYRRKMVKVLTRRLLAQALGYIQKGAEND